MSESLDLEPYDFLDYGCSDGRSLELAVRALGGVRGLGLDSSTAKVEQARARGHDAIEVDATRMPKCRGTVDFAILSHFLEHLPGVRDASRCIRHAIGVSRRYVYVQQPWFDSDFHLLRRGLKLYWSDWVGHTNRMTTLSFHSILQPLLTQGRIARYCIYGRDRIESSQSPDVHPLASPPDAPAWNPEVHPPRPEVVFDEPVYREIVVIVAVKDRSVVEEVCARVKPAERLLDSDAIGEAIPETIPETTDADSPAPGESAP